MALAFTMPLAVHADPTIPNAGAILQQNQPLLPPAPSPNETGLTVEGEGSAALPPTAPFLVTSIQVSGNSLFDTPALHAVIADAEGKSLTLPELAAVVARITNYYHAHGYPLARAIIPAQTIQYGIIRIEIIEARYGAVLLENSSRVNNPLLQATISALQSDRPIAQAPLDHALLLLSDIPGVAVVATLKPGENVGTSDLTVESVPTAAIAGNLALDNDGNRYTGRARAGGTLGFIDPLRHGDVLNFTGLTSGDMNYGSAGYESLWNAAGTRVGGSYSALHYILGSTFAPLDGHGDAEVESLWLKRPLLRSRDANIYAQIQVDHKRLDDKIGAGDIRIDRHLDNRAASLAGDIRDTLLSGGVSTWSLRWTSGRVGFDNMSAELADAATADTQGRFSEWNASFSRLQYMSQTNSLYLTLSGQRGDSNLDPAEKMIAGGAYTVRAYDIGALSGDSGIAGSLEFRHDLGIFGGGSLQAVAFVDEQHVTINHTVWSKGVNAATLQGTGLALAWTGYKDWSARAYVSAPFGPTPVLIGRNDFLHAWFAVSKGF